LGDPDRYLNLVFIKGIDSIAVFDRYILENYYYKVRINTTFADCDIVDYYNVDLNKCVARTVVPPKFEWVQNPVVIKMTLAQEYPKLIE